MKSQTVFVLAISLLAMLLLVLGCASQSNSNESQDLEQDLDPLQEEISTPLAMNAILARPTDLPDPPIDTPDEFLYAPDFSFTERTEASLTLTWHDSSEGAGVDGYELRRRTESSNWEQVAEWGPLNGWTEYTDSGLNPDTLYCYQFRVYKEEWEDFWYGEAFSLTPRCAYTRDGRSFHVWRVQLTLHTANVNEAGTNDEVFVLLTSGGSHLKYVTIPAGSQTWLDYGRPDVLDDFISGEDKTIGDDDFERGDEFTYDLNLGGVQEVGDITAIDIVKPGSDGWCLEYLSLTVNGVEIYNEYFGSTSSTCKRLDNEDGHSISYTVEHSKLREHPLWVSYVQPVPSLIIPRDELVSRIEGLVGHMLHDQKAYWGELSGSEYVEASKRGNQTVHIDLDLAGDVPVLGDPEVDIDFDLYFEISCSGSGDNRSINFEATTVNFDSNVDFDLLKEIVTLNGITFLENEIEERIEEEFRPITLMQVIEDVGICTAGYTPTVTVQDDASILFGYTDAAPDSDLCESARKRLNELLEATPNCDPDKPNYDQCVDDSIEWHQQFDAEIDQLQERLNSPECRS